MLEEKEAQHPEEGERVSQSPGVIRVMSKEGVYVRLERQYRKGAWLRSPQSVMSTELGC